MNIYSCIDHKNVEKILILFNSVLINSDNEKVKLKREGTWATWTNMDHCGDDVCGTPKTYSMVNDDIVVDDIIENSNISSKSKNKKDKS